MNLQHFNFNNNEIRVIDKNGEPWFIAKDVAEILCISNHRDTVNGYPEKEKDAVGITDSMGRNQNAIIISEAGLYRMIFQSRKKEAEKFKDWVFESVLPAIRKTGEYKKPKKEISDVRKKSIETRNILTDELKERGFNKPAHYIQFTLTQKKGLKINPKKKKVNYNDSELLMTTATEAMTMFHLKQQNLIGYKEIKPVAGDVAKNVWENTQGLIESKGIYF